MIKNDFMKRFSINKLKSVIVILILTQSLVSFKGQNLTVGTFKSPIIRQDSTIIGTWVSQNDNLWRLEFKNDSTLYSIYTGAGTDTCSFSISNSTPQCGITVPVENHTRYLKTININDNTDVSCYLINGITNTHLSLSVIDEGGVQVFIKQ
ncbi:hypothetical protein FYC62_12890 [Pedobacter aquae]|uniref:Lipocalin-like domain-containing protein n=1 Tax=Pedobacter aquae TaxID=2605747 RepID=A0A5C0VIA3_9SPHI|nr:hypothetical protein [Pedobacter aquae]QEK52448.1 hypothetical protein FYC62_12890 [Pedobacter aquae]